MDYLETFEPLHELEPDEIEHVLNQIWHCKECIFTEELSAKEVEEIGNRATGMIKILIHTLKKSLIYFFPDRDIEISELSDVYQATEYKYLLLDSGQYSTPLNEGADALVKLYSEIGPYYGNFPLSKEEMEQKQIDFAEMKLSLKNYFIPASRFFHERKMREAKPLIEEGVKRIKQLHAPKEKRNQYILAYCHELMKKRASPSAPHLFSRFPYSKQNAVLVDGVRIFRNFDSNTGEEKIITYMPDGKAKQPLGLRGFTKNYWRDFKKKKKKER